MVTFQLALANIVTYSNGLLFFFLSLFLNSTYIELYDWHRSNIQISAYNWMFPDTAPENKSGHSSSLGVFSV